MTTETVGLSQLIRTVLLESPTADPQDLVDEILSLINPGEERHYLREAIRSRVGTEAASMRGQSIAGAFENTAPRSARSAKRDAIREHYWTTMLRQRLYVADEWVFFGDATGEQLTEAAADRRAKAASIEQEAERLEQLAAALASTGVEYVSELEPELGTRIMLRDAA